MSPRRPRGAVQEPIEDYHDTARTGHEIGRPVENLAIDDGTALNRNTPSNEELHMFQTINAPARPANVPPRFRAECDTDGSLLFWGADLVAEDDFYAESVRYPRAPEDTRYNLELTITEGTSEEIRAALDRLCAWWASQEAHLDGTEVTR